MCEYCKNIKTGNDYNPILSDTVDLGFAGTIYVDVVLLRSENENPVIELDMCMDSKDANKVKKVQINYCPICGERL